MSGHSSPAAVLAGSAIACELHSARWEPETNVEASRKADRNADSKLRDRASALASPERRFSGHASNRNASRSLEFCHDSNFEADSGSVMDLGQDSESGSYRE